MNDPTPAITSIDAHLHIQIEGSASASDIVRAKLADADLPGFHAEFDPAEAEAAGAFLETALSEADALASAHDSSYFPVLPALQKL